MAMSSAERLARREAPGARFPLAFITVALVCLLVTPIFINRMVGRIRVSVLDVADQARILVSNFEAAFAQELLAEGVGRSSSEARDAIREAAIATERTSLRALSPVVARLGGDAVEHLVALRAAERQWRTATEASQSVRRPTQSANLLEHDGQAVLGATEAMYRRLIALTDEGRREARRLTNIELISTAVLTTLALAAMAVALALDRRARSFAREAADRARKLERSVELRTTLIQGVVHDVKNPLNAASGYAELLDEGVAGPLTEKQLNMLHRFKRLIDTALRTVAELVDLARVDAGEYPIERRPTDLVSAVREIVEDHRASALKKSIRLTFDSPAHALVVDSDAVRIRHVVDNLLSNALKYTPERGTIRVSIATQREFARVAVEDTGPGIPSDLKERIFDPFFRVPSTEKTPGSGLGLAVSRRIARLLGGDVTVSDTPGGGSIFACILPGVRVGQRAA